ncbi:MAG: response regulator [Nitrospirota bacterium]
MTAKSILIVDDEETLSFSIQMSFVSEKRGYEIVTAESGEDALEKLKSKRFDAAIVDIYLPGISGLDLIKGIKEKNPDTLIIMMSAYATMDKKDEALEYGALYFFEKPFDIKEVKKIVLKTLDSAFLT